MILTDDQSPRTLPTPECPQLVSQPGFGYGGDRVLTPNVDRLAREGMVMRNANVSCPVCSSSRYTTAWVGNCHNVEWTTRSVLDFLNSKTTDGDKPFFLDRGTTLPLGPSFIRGTLPNPLAYLVADSHFGFNSSQYNPHYFAADQLFDLENGPQEKHNVFDRHPEVVADLKARLKKHLTTFPGRPFGELTR